MAPLEEPLFDVLASPADKTKLTFREDRFICSASGRSFPLIKGVPSFVLGVETDDLSEFWEAGWENRLKTDHSYLELNNEDYRAFVEERLEQSKLLRTPISDVSFSQEETVLNIGCGLNEASSFIVLGANRYIGIDYSLTACIKSREMMGKLAGKGLMLHANAEFLPLKKSVIDLVYTSGVIHHTPNIVSAVSEIHRVLKPGGKAVVGLYNKFSPKFIMAFLLGHLRSLFSKQKKHWYAHTETSWYTEDDKTPFTLTFSKRQFLALFEPSDFTLVAIRKTGFNWGDSVPIIGKYFQKTNLGNYTASKLSSTLGSMWVAKFSAIKEK